MTKYPQKKNLSSIQVLKTLSLLMENDYSMSELIKKLNEREHEPIFNNSVISKYINTCRQSGIKIPKINNKYYVTHIPFGLKLDDSESEMLQFLKDVVIDEMSSKACDRLQNFVDKINRYANKKITPVEKKMYFLAFESFERAINCKRKVKLLFRNKEEFEGIPVAITKENNKIFFHVHSKNRIRMIDVSRLSSIEILQDQFTGYMNEQSIVFTLKGKLAKRYQTREEENLIDFSETNDTITVSNKCRSTEMLLSRLMRYDNLCEINSPRDVRVQMKNLINDTLKNYGID